MSSRPFRIPCRVCGQGFLDEISAETHCYFTHFGPIYSCDGCGYQTVSCQDIDTHDRHCMSGGGPRCEHMEPTPRSTWTSLARLSLVRFVLALLPTR